jgi:general secretion pathway protein G
MESRRERGFTLVEMMVVIVIIGVLATIVIVNVSGKADIAKVRATEAILKSVASNVAEFKMNHNRYPNTLSELVKMPPDIDPKTWPRDGYLLEMPVDGWGRELLYRQPGANGASFDLYSLGEDGHEGGEGPAADIYWRKGQR